MKAPLSWLQEYVPIELSVDELASRLALTGTEVERVSLMGVSPEGDNLGRFVVGKVLDRQRHPDADKLSVCIVDVGEAEPRTIVCGAPNVASGQTVGVVLPGGTMPNGMQIKDAKLRGVKSSGMIMSEAELGLAAKSEGTMELPGDWQAGSPSLHVLPALRLGAGGGGHPQPPRLPLRPWYGPRDSGHHPGAVRRGFALPLSVGRPARGRGHRHRGPRPRSVPALRGPSHPRRAHRRFAAVAEGAHRPGGHAAGQQRRGRDQLRALGPGSAPSRLRPADHTRGSHHRAAGVSGRERSPRSTTRIASSRTTCW